MAKKKAAEKEESILDKAIANGHDADASTADPAAPTAEAETKKEPEAPKAPGKIQQILAHFQAGKTNKEISQLPVLDAEGNPVKVTNEKGEEVIETFHPTTISIQINKFKKKNPDRYPPKPPAKTKAQLKEEAKAAAEAAKAAPAEAPQAEAATA